MTRRLIVDGADVTAVIPRFENRLVNRDSFYALLERKRVSESQLSDFLTISNKALWRFTHQQRVMPVTVVWRIASNLTCRADDFSSQHPEATAIARKNMILWESRHLPGHIIQDLVEAFTERLRDTV